MYRISKTFPSNFMQLCHLQEIMFSLPPKQEKTEVISRGVQYSKSGNSRERSSTFITANVAPQSLGTCGDKAQCHHCQTTHRLVEGRQAYANRNSHLQFTAPQIIASAATVSKQKLTNLDSHIFYSCSLFSVPTLEMGTEKVLV